MPSITTWMRLEPGFRDTDMTIGLQARIYDPLWLLARQWQIGEFQGDDTASPAEVRWHGECARLTRYLGGSLQDKPPIEGRVFDSATIPLETLVECEPGSDAKQIGKIRFAAEAGQHFLRMVDQQPISQNYHDLFKSKYAFSPLTSEERQLLDADSLAFIDLVTPRVPDGRKLYSVMSGALRPAAPSKSALPSDLTIAAGDVAEVQAAAEAWLHWYETLITEPSGGSPSWTAERMEYGFSLATHMAAGEKVLTAQEYFGGHLDWYDFDMNESGSLHAGNDPVGKTLTQTVMPAPVGYRGMPAPRFWEFEDARVDFGAVNAGPEDLARMLLVEFALSYGNDWFVIPIDLDVGALCRTYSLVVTNTFGERFVIRSSNDAGEPYATWRMYQLSSLVQPKSAAAGAELFLLPPALITSLQSRPVEEVLFLRDEMANMAWAVERVIESATERPLNRFEQQRYAPAPEQAHDKLIYKLASAVPEYWVPLLPVRRSSGLRLQRGQVLSISGSPEPVKAQGRVLNPDGIEQDGLLVYEEEIPREGIRLTRRYQLTRWQDGSTHLWIGRKKEIGRGEGSSGLRFDTLLVPTRTE
jgi:hypothetical protein